MFELKYSSLDEHQMYLRNLTVLRLSMATLRGLLCASPPFGTMARLPFTNGGLWDNPLILIE